MKITINNQNRIEYVNKSIEHLNRFINYCNDYPDNMEYNRYKDIAQFVIDNINDKIALHVLSYAMPSNEILSDKLYPNKIIQMLYKIRYYVFKNYCDITKYSDLHEQNEATKNYIHFDFSVKKVKTINDFLTN